MLYSWGSSHAKFLLQASSTFLASGLPVSMAPTGPFMVFKSALGRLLSGSLPEIGLYDFWHLGKEVQEKPAFKSCKQFSVSRERGPSIHLGADRVFALGKSLQRAFSFLSVKQESTTGLRRMLNLVKWELCSHLLLFRRQWGERHFFAFSLFF